MAPHTPKTRYTFTLYLFGLLWKCAHKHIINIKGHKSKSLMIYRMEHRERKCEMERKRVKEMKERRPTDSRPIFPGAIYPTDLMYISGPIFKQ